MIKFELENVKNKEFYDFTEYDGYEVKKSTKGPWMMHYFDGTKLDSPSKITSHLSDFTKIDPEVLKEAIRRGSEFTNAVEDYTNGKEVKMSPEYQEIFNQFLYVMKEKGLTPVGAEYLVFSKKHLYRGYIDLIAVDQEDNIWIIENKTRVLSYGRTSPIYNNVQLVLYKWALEEMFDLSNVKLKYALYSYDKYGKEAIIEEIDDIDEKVANDVLKFYDKFLRGNYFLSKIEAVDDLFAKLKSDNPGDVKLLDAYYNKYINNKRNKNNLETIKR